MNSQFSRIESLIGIEALKKLSSLRVAIFGVGGVGSVCAESLIRSGVFNLTLIDSDTVVKSNINRQIPAYLSTIGQSKVNVLKERFKDINPNATVNAIQALYSKETSDNFDFKNYDIVIDAIDSLSHKIDLLITASNASCKVFCSLGAAGKLDSTCVRTASIWKTKGCSLGKLVRSGLRKRGFEGDFLSVYSEEPTLILKNLDNERESHGNSSKMITLGSSMSVTAAFGLALSSLVIKEVIR